MNWKKILAFSLLLIGCLQFAWTSTHILSYEYDVDYAEGFMLRGAENLLEGDLYNPPSAENNYLAEKYPPVFYTVLAAFSSIFGLSYTTGRFISLLSMVTISVLIYLIIDSKSNKTTIIPSLLVFGSLLSIYSGLLLRVDALGVLLSLGGLYMLSKRKYYLFLILSLLAVFTKQIFISVFLAGVAHITLQKEWRKDISLLKSFEIKNVLERNKETLKFAFIYGLSVIGIALSLEFLTGGFIKNVLLANMGGWSVQYSLLNWAFLTFLPLFALAFYYTYLFRDTLIGSYFVLSLFFGLIQFTRSGAYINPMLEPFIASLICLGLLYTKAPRLQNNIHLIVILQILIFFTAPLANGSLVEITPYTPTVKDADKEIMESIENHSSVYSENPGYAWKETSEFPPEIWSYYESYSKGELSKQEIKQVFRKENYSVIVTHNRLSELPLENYISKNYKLEKTINRKRLDLLPMKWKIYKKT